jgi:hypothetical protein
MASGSSRAETRCGDERPSRLLAGQVDLLPKAGEEVLHGGIVDQVQHHKHRGERHREGYDGPHSSRLTGPDIDRALEEDNHGACRTENVRLRLRRINPPGGGVAPPVEMRVVPRAPRRTGLHGTRNAGYRARDHGPQTRWSRGAAAP